MQYGLRVGGSLRGRFTRQLQHLLHMRYVLLAQLHRLGIRFQVVVAIRKTETALVGIRNHLRGVLGVRGGIEVEESYSAQEVKADQLVDDLAL